MAYIRKRSTGYLVCWREYPGAPEKSKAFPKGQKAAADRFRADLEHRLFFGTYVEPQAGQITVAAYAEEWAGRRHWRPSNVERVERELRLHILPALGARPLSSLRRAHIEGWAAGLDLAPATVHTMHATLSSLLEAAVEDGRIVRNPAAGARLPRVEVVPLVPLTAEEVRALAAGITERLRAALLLAAGTGLRQGELFGLTVDRVDFMRRELRVDRQLWSPKTGPSVFAPPKSKNSYRSVALSPLVVDALAAHLAAFGPGQHGVLFHRDGGEPYGRVHGGNAIRAARGRAADILRDAARQRMLGSPPAEVELAVAAAREPVAGTTWHDLRHHHASVLLSAGVSPALVAERLGHDIQTLLRTYAHVIRQDEDRVRAVVDEALGGTAADWLRTQAV
jgi:integrase